MHTVFCYGTLRLGESNHNLMKGAKRKEDQFWTIGKLYDTGDGYPALIQSEESKVYGEVYEVDDELLEKIDVLEGFQEGRDYNLYDRVMKKVSGEKGSYDAITYVMRNPEERFIEIRGGDWVKYRQNG
ncbi:MAG: gamma-glutamylcyclotransferase family protein [Anaerobacillus sp.]